MDLREIVLAALKEASPEKPLLGAAFGVLASRIAASNGLIFKEELKGAGLTLKKLLEKMPGEVQLRPAPHSPDFLIMRPGQAAPKDQETEEPRKLRRDVYTAFTRLREEPLFYDPVHDKFRADKTEATNIVVPSVTLDELINDRRAFAEGISDAEVSASLLTSLEDRSSALTTFKQSADRANLEQRWHTFNADRIRNRIQIWASANGLPFRPSWQHDEQSAARDPRHTLLEVAKYMTDEEVRTLQIPVRAVEALILIRGLKT